MVEKNVREAYERILNSDSSGINHDDIYGRGSLNNCYRILAREYMATGIKFYKENNEWVAELFDVCGVGNTKSEALYLLTEAIQSQIDYHGEEYVNSFTQKG